MEGPRAYNPENLAPSNPVRDRAQRLAMQKRIQHGTLAERIFVFLFERAGGRPGSVETSLRELLREPCCDAGSGSNVRKALSTLDQRGLIGLPTGRLEGRFKVGVLTSAPAAPQRLLPEIAADQPRGAALSVCGDGAESKGPTLREEFDAIRATSQDTEGAHHRCAPVVRTTHPRCAPTVRTDSANGIGEKKSSAQTQRGMEKAGDVAARIVAREEAKERELLERSERSERQDKSFDVQNVQNVPPPQPTTGLVDHGSTPTPVSDGKFVSLLHAITEQIGPNDNYPSMPYQAALLVHDGALSEDQLYAALETCSTWREFTGALKWQAARNVAAELARRGVLDDSQLEALRMAPGGTEREALWVKTIDGIADGTLRDAAGALDRLGAWSERKVRMPRFPILKKRLKELNVDFPAAELHHCHRDRRQLDKRG